MQNCRSYHLSSYRPSITASRVKRQFVCISRNEMTGSFDQLLDTLLRTVCVTLKKNFKSVSSNRLKLLIIIFLYTVSNNTSELILWKFAPQVETFTFFYINFSQIATVYSPYLISSHLIFCYISMVKICNFFVLSKANSTSLVLFLWTDIAEVIVCLSDWCTLHKQYQPIRMWSFSS